MVTVIMTELNLSYTDFGFIFSATMLGLILFRIPWGLISDRIGYLNVLRIALPLCTVFAILRAFSPGFLSLLLSQFFLGLVLAAVLPCFSLIVREWAPRGVGLFTGIYVSGFAAGNATALALTPCLLKILGWREILLIYSGLAAIICLLWWSFAKSTVKDAPGLPPANFKKILKDRYVWVLLFFMIASMGSYDALATWMPKVLELKDLSKALASLLPLGFFFAGPIIGSITDRFANRKTIVALLGIIAAVSIMGINYAPFPLLLLCIFLSGFTTTGVLTISLAMPAQHQRLSANAASVVGLTSSLGNIGSLIMPGLFGFLIDITGTFHTSILTVSALAGVIFIFGSRIRE
jgi:cyanate permease